MVGLGIADGVLGNLDRILVAVLGVDGDIYLLGQHLELVDGGGTVDVASHEEGTARLLGLELTGQLARECGFAGTLQARHENHRGVARKID